MLLFNGRRSLVCAAVAAASLAFTASDALALNPQPLPPGQRVVPATVRVSPQPLPVLGTGHFLNPQPLPPIVD